MCHVLDHIAKIPKEVSDAVIVKFIRQCDKLH